MREPEEHLCEVLENLMRIRNECSCSVFSECGLADMTVKQIAYLKTIGEERGITFTKLAEKTRNSKPTITEMVNRFVQMECVYREPCPDDGRIQYIRLTERGQRIAHAEQFALRRMIERMAESLDDNEMELLISLIGKVR